MKLENHHFTKRSSELLEKKEFMNISQINDFEFILDSSDKILTVTYSPSNSDLELLFKEVVIKFSKGRLLKQVLEINLRELDSFLRDENHLPAFPEANFVELSQLLENLLISMVTSALYTKNMSFKTLSETLNNDWNDLNLVEKNQWAFKLVGEIQKELKLNLEVVWCEESVLTIKINQDQGLKFGIEVFISKFLGGSKNVLPIKVVAV